MSGSGPAYVFYLAEAMIAGGVEAGLDAATARELTTQTILGAAKLLAESDEDAAELRRRVTSPNGTTAAAIAAFDDRDVKGAIVEGVVAAADGRRAVRGIEVRPTLVWSDALTDYNLGPSHPLAPIRVELAVALARELGVLDRFDIVEPQPLSVDELATVHARHYIAGVQDSASIRTSRTRPWDSAPATTRSSTACTTPVRSSPARRSRQRGGCGPARRTGP